MIRKAGPEDAGAIEAFLAPLAETSMFLRSNLSAHGIGQRDHDHSTDIYLWETGDRAGGTPEQRTAISGVYGLTRNGFLLAQAPELTAEAATAFAKAIAGRRVQGMTGVANQVAQVLTACGISTDDLALNRSEPLYRLRLSDLEDAPKDLRPATNAHVPLLARWFADDMVETETVPAGADPEAAGRARAEAAPGGPLRILFEDGTPVAMASLNADVGGMVQLGGVYVPKPLRRKGRGSAVVIARMIEARATGADTAILFAANQEAARMYERIGFQWIGQYQIALLRSPHEVHPR